jgi:hypothetical protein
MGNGDTGTKVKNIRRETGLITNKINGCFPFISLKYM